MTVVLRVPKVTKESEHVVQVLHDEKDWHKSIAVRH
jgi:hypothetical protein